MELTQQDNVSDKAQIARKQARERFWQVLFPVIFVSLLVVGLAVYIILNSRGGGVSLEQLGGVASIIIILPTVFGLILVLAVSIGLIYLLAKLTGVIPNLAQKVILVFRQAETEIKKVAVGAADPIIKSGEIIAKANQILSSLQKRLK